MFSERLKLLREEKNLTQNDLAKVLGLKRQSISNYENNGRQPDFKILNKIADFFKVTTDYLTGRSDFRTYDDELKFEKIKGNSNTDNIPDDLKNIIIKTCELVYKINVNNYNYSKTISYLNPNDAIFIAEDLYEAMSKLYKLLPDNDFGFNPYAEFFKINNIDISLISEDEKNNILKKNNFSEYYINQINELETDFHLFVVRLTLGRTFY